MFLIKKSKNTFWKKVVVRWKKDNPKEESITEDPEKEPIAENSKRTLS